MEAAPEISIYLIQLEGEQYVLAGVCWGPQEWILEVGLQSRKTINNSAQSMRVNAKSPWRAARLQSSCTGVHIRTRHRSAMSLAMYYAANQRSDGD
jgi:hypothetical protein